jgi:hypothetical protein
MGIEVDSSKDASRATMKSHGDGEVCVYTSFDVHGGGAAATLCAWRLQTEPR